MCVLNQSCMLFCQLLEGFNYFVYLKLDDSLGKGDNGNYAVAECCNFLKFNLLLL